MFYVYKITNLVNGKLYIGKTNNINNRWNSHCSEANLCRKRYPLYLAMKKYGVENFKIEMLETLENEEKCFQRETYWIEFFKTNIVKYGHDFGYNLSDGGEGPSGHKDTPEQKKRKSIRQTGNNNNFYGKTHSKESRKRISDARKGKSISDDAKKKISEKLRGKPKSEETKKRMSDAFTGRRYTQKQRENMGKSKRGKPNYKKRGSKHHNAKTTENEVIEIRLYWNNNNDIPKNKIKYLIEKFRLTESTIKQIVYKKTWKHLL